MKRSFSYKLLIFNDMKRVEFCAADYDYTKTYPDIDYSERITESGLVLSMREIYNRYAAMGVDILHGEFIDDDEDPDRTDIEDFDDPLDMLQRSEELKSREIPARRKARVPGTPDGKKPDGNPRQTDTPLSARDAASTASRQEEITPRNARQSAAKQSDGAHDQE